MLFSDLIANAQQLANMVNVSFVDATAWLKWADLGQQELYRLVVSAYKDHWYATSDVVVVNVTGTASMPGLPGAKLLGVTKDAGTPMRQTIHRYQQGNRDGRSVVITYRPQGATIQFEPIENCAGNYRLYYQSPPAAPVNPASVFDPVLEQWDEYVSVAMAMKALTKAEKPLAGLDVRLKLLKAAVVQMATIRDVSQPGRVADVDDRPARRLWRR